MKKSKCLAWLGASTMFAGSLLADTTLVFNEIMYHPQTKEPLLEWIEFHNQLAVDLDVSGWYVTNGVYYQFPPGTVIKGGGYVVVASSPETLAEATGVANILGPFANRLSNAGELLELRNNNDRVVDAIEYGVEGDWPVAADGSGASLAKRDPDSGSAEAVNWTHSGRIGGTPGRANFVSTGANSITAPLIAIDQVWKYDASGNALADTWRSANYNDTNWPSGSTLLSRPIQSLYPSGVNTNGVILAPNQRDPHYLLTASAHTISPPPPIGALVMTPNGAWLANDTNSRWIGPVNSGATSLNGGEYDYRTTFTLNGFALGTVRLNLELAADNVVANVLLNGVSTGIQHAGFAAFSAPFTLTSGFVPGTNVLDFEVINEGAGPGGFRVKASGAGLVFTNRVPSGPITHYFRTKFRFDDYVQGAVLRLRPIVNDGAVFYLNGVEILRVNMPSGPVTASTYASTAVTEPAFSGPFELPVTNLVAGNNVLAVEVHQASGHLDDLAFALEASVTSSVPAPVWLAFNELGPVTNNHGFVELINYSTNACDLAGMVLVRQGANDNTYVFGPDTELAPGGIMAYAFTALGFQPQSDDRLFLYGPGQQVVLDAVAIKSSGRGRYPAAVGPWFHPSQPTPGETNQFAFQDAIVINEIMYRHRLIQPANSPLPVESDEEWLELYNRSANPVELTGWRLDGGISYRFDDGQTIPAGGYLVVAGDATALRALYPAVNIVGNYSGRLSNGGETILLRDPSDNLADQVRYYDYGRWPEAADGGGSSLELRDPLADNSSGEAWASSDEAGKSSWQQYTYRGTNTIPSGSGQPTRWQDFVFGLLGAGECLIDDITVVEFTGGSSALCIANGDFESGLSGWRVLGNHNQSRLETDPDDPSNHVLRVVATGPQEHMHNHIERTLQPGRTITSGRVYQISFRAKWLSGINLLNTRLYFNRVPQTTALPAPERNGTPGARNSRYEPNLGPTFSGLRHEPVVPNPNEPVTVFVTASDPQGIAQCALRWSVNGGAWSNAPMTLMPSTVTDAPSATVRNFKATIPGYAAGAIVQFYVAATDGPGAASVFPAGSPAAGALYMVNDGQANFTRGHNVRIILTPSNRDLLHAMTNVMSNDNLPCTVVYDERRAHYGARVRLKGSERGRYSDTRASFRLEFPPDDLFNGVHPVMLIDRSGAGDSGDNKQQEILIKHMLNRAGGIPGTYVDLCRVIAPFSRHTSSAMFSPRLEDEFIATAFENGGDGQLFELELIYYPTSANSFGYKLPNPDDVVGTDIQNLGDNKEYYRYNFMIKNHHELDDYSRFIAMAKTWSLTGATLEAAAPLVMDVEEWMRVWALVSLCGVNDSYTFGNNHNLFMYSRPSDKKFLAFPADMDFSFNRGASSSLVGDQNLSKVINLSRNLRVFYAHVQDLINTTYNTNYMNYWIGHYNQFVPEQNYTPVKSFIQQRITTALAEIRSRGGNSNFNVTTPSTLTTNSSLITLAGTAPVGVQTITVNGKEYPITWTTVSGWRMLVPISAATNTLLIEAYDLYGWLITTNSRTVTVHYTGPVYDPGDAIVFSEILFNPELPEASFVELFNTSTASFDLSGWRINGLDYVFPAGAVMTNRQTLVLAKNLMRYASVYTTMPPAFDEFPGELDPDGETLTLLRPGATAGQELIVDQVRYEAVQPWPVGTNGLMTASSIQLIDPSRDNSRPCNWYTRYAPAVWGPPTIVPGSTNDGWRQIKYTNTIQGGATPATNLVIFLNTGGTVYLDDISIVPAGGGENLVANGGFESPMTGTWNALGNHGNSTITAGFSFSGTSSLKLVGTGSGGLNNYVTQDIPLLASNTTCVLSFRLYATTAATNITLRTLPGTAFACVTNVGPILVPDQYFPPQVIQPLVWVATPGRTNNTGLGPLQPIPNLWLNEVEPVNASGLRDAAGERDPWLELYNAGTTTVSLQGLYLANNYTNLTQWAFPAGASINPGEYKVIFLDGQPAQSTTTEYHTSFRLQGPSGQVALARVTSRPEVLDYLTYTNLASDRSYGDAPNGQPFYRQTFAKATPGASNEVSSFTAPVFINEWMAANTRTLMNSRNGNQYDDWFELYNPGTNVVDLAGYYLTDNLTNATQFKIPDGYRIPPRGFLLVWADSEPQLNQAGDPDLHVNFRLSRDGEQLGLFAPDHATVDAVTFGFQTDDVTQGHLPDGTGPVVALAAPSPRASNAATGNTPPEITPVADRMVYPGEAVQFSITAADHDQPPQVLTYSLDQAPTGATINPGTGLFLWTVPQAQAPGSVSAAVRVTDNGTPPQSATQSFNLQIAPLPQLGLLAVGGGKITARFATVPGKTYRVLYKNELTDPAWLALGADRVATGSEMVLEDALGTQSHRFYRITLAP